MKRQISLEKYIKKYTGVDLKVFSVKWIVGGFAGYNKFDDKGHIVFREDHLHYKPLIWHEMGHLMGHSNNWVENEVIAQSWALKTLKKLGYKKIYQESIAYVKRWQTCRAYPTIKDKEYAKASKIILRKYK